METQREMALPQHMQEEIWKVMHMVAELGAHPEANKFKDNRFLFECDGESDSDDEADELTEGDSPSEHSEEEEKLIGVVETLGAAADNYDREQAIIAEDTLVQDIIDYLRKKGDGYVKDYAALKENGPTYEIFKTEVMGSLYSYFKLKLEGFLGQGEDISKLALVSHVTKGVAAGFRDSSSDVVNLIACLSTKFIADKYGNFLMQHGGLVKLVMESSVDRVH